MNCDLLEFGPAEARRIVGAAAEAAGLDRDSVILTATHTHTGPAVIELAGEDTDEAYLVFLEGRVRLAAKAAAESAERCTARAGRSECRSGVNRRKREAGGIVMAPNPSGPSDPEVLSLLFEDRSGRPRALLINHAVHPTTLSVDSFLVSADYPGRTAKRLQESLGKECAVLFLQGACGDVKPAVLTPDGKAFKEGTEEDIEGLGAKLAASVLEALAAAKPIAEPRLGKKKASLAFRYAGLPTRGELALSKARYTEEARSLESRGGPKDLPHRSRGSGPGLRTLGGLHGPQPGSGSLGRGRRRRSRPLQPRKGVRLSRYPRRAFLRDRPRDQAAKPLPLQHCLAGYCGGSLGYLPTRQALLEGGYEAADAFKFYGHPAAFNLDTEDTILEACDKLLKA